MDSALDDEISEADIILEKPEDELLDGGAVADRNLPSNVNDYQECALSVPVGRAMLDLSISELAPLSRAVVEAEGPIHTEEVARRIREAFGLQKTGRRILTHIGNSLTFLSRDETLARDAEFWSVPGRTVSFIRNRRMAALPLRKAVMIAPAEYRLAITTAVKEAVALSRDDLAIQATRLFGFDRTGADLKQEIEQQVDVLIRTKAIIYDGEKIRMDAS
jgi:Protein of unknown function (DUF3320)